MWLWRIKQPVVYEDVQWQQWPDISQLSIFPQPIHTLLMATMMQLSEFPVHLISCKKSERAVCFTLAQVPASKSIYYGGFPLPSISTRSSRESIGFACQNDTLFLCSEQEWQCISAARGFDTFLSCPSRFLKCHLPERAFLFLFVTYCLTHKRIHTETGAELQQMGDKD